MGVLSICKIFLDSFLLNVNCNFVKYIYLLSIGYNKMKKEMCGVGIRVIVVCNEWGIRYIVL